MVSLKPGPDGQRRRKKVSGKIKTEVWAKLAELHDELNDGIVGAVPLRELTAATVRSTLKELAATRATRTVAMAHAGLTRATRHAEANDKVRRNVATLVDTPAGRGPARPSRSLSVRPLP